MDSKILAGSVVAVLVTLGGGVGLFGACSPSAVSSDGGVDGAVCNPDSGDTIGCGCDPTTYKESTCYTGPPGTNGKGICQTGLRQCNPDGTLTACLGEVTPKPEICNLADDDCNGIVDDVPEIADAGTLANCNSPACDPSYTDAAINCWGADLGICGAGRKVCAPGPKGGTPNGCAEFVKAGVPEVCNGLDDDCNGIIDDGLNAEGPCDMDDGSTWPPDANPFDGGSPTLILGECVHGNLTCVDSNCTDRACADAGDKCFPKAPTPEVCNGKDDNCNGQIDEHSCANNPYGDYWCCVYGTYGYCDYANYGGCTYAK